MVMRKSSLSNRSVVSCLALLCALPAFACSSDEKTSGGGSGGGSGSGGQPGNGGSSEWTMLGYDSHSTFWNSKETQINKDTVKDLEVAWTKDMGGNITGAPIMFDGRVCVASSARAGCYDVETGAVIWEDLERTSVTSTFAYASNTLFIHDFNGNLHAVDPDTGETKWSKPYTQEGSAGFSSPMVGGDLLIVGGSTFQEVVPSQAPTFQGYVYAIEHATGDDAWKTPTVPENATGASLWSSVSIDVEKKRVFAGTGNNYTEPNTDTSDALIALNMETGAIEWKNQRFAGDIWSLFTASLGNPDFDFGTNPILYEAEIDGTPTELLAAGQKSGDIHILRRDDGSEICKRNLSPGRLDGKEGIFNNGAYNGKYLFFAGNGATSDEPGSEKGQGAIGPSVLFAIDPTNCDTVWERELPGVTMAPITLADGVGFVAAEKTLIAFDTDTGATLFRHVMADGSTIASAPTIANGKVAFGSGLQWFFGVPGNTLTVLHLK